MLQLAVHLYSFDGEMTPVEYLQKLLNYFKRIANMKGHNTAKLFEDPSYTTIGDSALL